MKNYGNTYITTLYRLLRSYLNSINIGTYVCNFGVNLV
nr:MAG TPA: hypothetical protein [Bacteriophage sp.]